jgi:hypothetical protein
MLIRSKSGSVQALRFNRAQQYIHERLEDQKRRTGKVRALILKGRQQGCSTYVSARYYHASSWRKGVRTFILTHEDAATQNLFEMVNRYHENCPQFVRPSTGAANAKELLFDVLDSGYKVGTAGTKGVGRSSTVQLFHGSEVAFWKNAETHAAGVLQAVPNEDGTEVILESTANGIGNFYHQNWLAAERGEGDFIAIWRAPALNAGNLHRGDAGPGVAWAKDRLSRLDRGANGEAGPAFFDAELEERVRKLQLAYGIKADGIIGPETLFALSALDEAGPHLIRHIE